MAKMGRVSGFWRFLGKYLGTEQKLPYWEPTGENPWISSPEYIRNLSNFEDSDIVAFVDETLGDFVNVGTNFRWLKTSHVESRRHYLRGIRYTTRKPGQKRKTARKCLANLENLGSEQFYSTTA
jgi:hypothetical protein